MTILRLTRREFVAGLGQALRPKDQRYDPSRVDYYRRARRRPLVQTRVSSAARSRAEEP
jgi:hypothetical protein